MKKGLAFCVFSLFLLPVLPSESATVNIYGGTYANWPTEWEAIPSLNDPVDSGVPVELDFIGDAIDPCASWTSDTDYVYFRMRVGVDDVSATTFGDAHFVLIDILNVGVTNVPDWGFAWDSKSDDNTRHGVELSSNIVAGTTWETSKMTDSDGLSADKQAPPDFGVDNGDAYLRIVGNISTTNFGLTSYIEFAISWAHLESYTTLRKGQAWRIQFASLENANDHNFMDSDIAGNHNPADANSLQYWSSSLISPNVVFSGPFGTAYIFD